MGDIGEMLPLSIFDRIVLARASELPRLWEWQEARIAEARLTGRVTLPFTGQSRCFLPGTVYDVNEIVNFPVQSTAANALLCIQHYIHARLRTVPLSRRTILPFLNVFDAIKFDCRSPSDVSFLRDLIAEAMDFLLTRGYWSWLQALYGRSVPLKYELETHECP